ncbi:MAG: 1-deoxy-D-xylulose-5-phosphate reductoisomerase [Actinobacteria bacterium]|nr:1-deoxy-D-xylulose-5-phosphate reductoisomerase [Actinomycetota bacterium]
MSTTFDREDVSGLFDDPEPIRVVILGSTGSVGAQALEVVRSHRQRFRVVGLAARSDAESLAQQAKEFEVDLVGIVEGELEPPPGAKVITGERSAAEIVEEATAEVVLNAVLGAAGLEATLATLKTGKTLALANKESLVAAGEYVMAKAGPGQIRPVDSEHSAMWQALEGTSPDRVSKVYLTASGGPFRGRSRNELERVTVEEAVAHPVWNMGRKISVDSATLMNKGFEVIEAHFLFGFTYDEIEVVIHPEGLIHAMIEMADTSVLAAVYYPDMRLPIQLALGWPERFRTADMNRISFSEGTSLSFHEPDVDTFRCLSLAYDAARRGDTYPAVLNAANEVAVAHFLEEKIGFLDIERVVEEVLDSHSPGAADLENVIEQDQWARDRAAEVTGKIER